MEMQYFIKFGEQMKWYEYWKEICFKWYFVLGMFKEMLCFYDYGENLVYYVDVVVDIQFNFLFGFKELEGIYSWMDFDLGVYQEFFGKKLQFFDFEIKESYVFYVLEIFIGCDWMFLVIML